MTGRVGPVARGLGFAGLLPQAALLAGIVLHDDGYDFMRGLAFAYAALIFVFLGGIWWGWAMRREARQAALAVLGIAPTLVTIALVAVAIHGSLRWAMVAIGSAIMLTLLADRHLVATGEAPAGWMALRVPLSLGLGLLTIAAAVA